jgi:hypothetical protein
MVVMDCVDGMSVWQFQEDKKLVPAIVLKDIDDALHILHAKDIVFGARRPARSQHSLPCIQGSCDACLTLIGAARMEKTDTR